MTKHCYGLVIIIVLMELNPKWPGPSITKPKKSVPINEKKGKSSIVKKSK